jgi:hypothetical protein
VRKKPTGNMGLAGFDGLWQVKLTLGGCGGSSPQRKCNSRNQKDGGWYILSRAGESKMEIPAQATGTVSSMERLTALPSLSD